MCIDESSESAHLPENLSVSKQNISFDLKDSPILRLKQPLAASYSMQSTPSNSPLLNQRHPGTGVPIISHKVLKTANQFVIIARVMRFFPLGFHAKSPQHPTNAQSGLGHSLGLFGVQFAQSKPADATSRDFNAQLEPEQFGRVPFQLLQL